MSTLLAIVLMASALLQLLIVFFLGRALAALERARHVLLRPQSEQEEE